MLNRHGRGKTRTKWNHHQSEERMNNKKRKQELFSESESGALYINYWRDMMSINISTRAGWMRSCTWCAFRSRSISAESHKSKHEWNLGLLDDRIEELLSCRDITGQILLRNSMHCHTVANIVFETKLCNEEHLEWVEKKSHWDFSIDHVTFIKHMREKKGFFNELFIAIFMGLLTHLTTTCSKSFSLFPKDVDMSIGNCETLQQPKLKIFRPLSKSQFRRKSLFIRSISLDQKLDYLCPVTDHTMKWDCRLANIAIPTRETDHKWFMWTKKKS